MLAKESSKFDISDELLEVLPSDPFEQLDVARKITSIALSTRVDALESEVSELRHQLADRDEIISGLESQLESFDASLNEVSEKLAVAQQEKENLMRENAQLNSTVKKLNRDVAKLESFRKTLMRSLQEDEDNPASAPKAAAPNPPSNNEDDTGLPPNQTTSMQSQFSDAGNSNSGDTETEAVRPRVPRGLLLASQTSTPRLTPPGSPPSLSASVSPSRTPKPVSPRRHSISFSTTRGLFDDRSSVFSSVPSSQFSSMSSLESGSQPGKTRVDGKEFFRQVRTRLSYEQFGAFLANVKELNSHKQTKEYAICSILRTQEGKMLYTRQEYIGAMFCPFAMKILLSTNYLDSFFGSFAMNTLSSTNYLDSFFFNCVLMLGNPTEGGRNIRPR